MGYGPWGRRESDRTERLSTHVQHHLGMAESLHVHLKLAQHPSRLWIEGKI